MGAHAADRSPDVVALELRVERLEEALAFVARAAYALGASPPQGAAGRWGPEDFERLSEVIAGQL